MRVANSPYYGARQQISGIEKAVIRIGFNAIKEIALCQKICGIFIGNETYRGFSELSLWKHSVSVALLGKMIFRMEFRERGENIYTAGLLHEIGIIAEDQLVNEDFKKVLEIAGTDKQNLSEVEEKIFGYHHGELGKELLDLWNLPPGIGMAVGFHHFPHAAPQEYSKIAMTLYIADCLCHDKEMGYCDSPFRDEKVYKQCLVSLGLKPSALDMIVEHLEKEIFRMQGQGLL